MPKFILDLNIVEGPVLIVFSLVSLGLAIWLSVRRGVKRWALIVLVAAMAGALIALLVVFMTVHVFNVFGVKLSRGTVTWAAVTFAAVGLALANLWKSRARRKVLAFAAILVFVITGGLGINASIGITKTLSALLGISTVDPLPTPDRNVSPAPDSPVSPAPTNSDPLYKVWNPPGDLPAAGKVGSIDIPNDKSGFAARAAVAYLPPAAQVEGAPRLPVVIQLNGQPGSPNLDDTSATLDKLAASNRGLAPIVINPDQLGGDGSIDSMCLDTSLGNVDTYIMQDVVPYVKAHFNVIDDPRYWTILGFSDGGECASYFGAKYPTVFGNFVDMSGDEYPGVENSATVDDYFGGDQAAYEKTWPANIMKSTTYPDSLAVFTVGGNDEFKDGITRVYNAAMEAGIKASYVEIPGSGHDGASVTGGLNAAFAALYPRWGLSAPVG